MSIIWKYLDKRSGTVQAIRDYESMRFIIDNTAQQVKEIHERMDTLASPQYDGVPHAKNPHANEERIVHAIDDIDVLGERYRQAREYMDWFEPAWQELSDDERYVLETFYSEGCDATSSVYDICERFNIERTSAYKRKNRALQKLSVLLFGKP